MLAGLLRPQQRVGLRLGRIAHQAYELAHLQAQRVLHLLIAAALTDQIVAQNGIGLAHAVGPILRLTVHRRGPVQLTEHHAGSPLQVQAAGGPKGNAAQIGTAHHEALYAALLHGGRFSAGDARGAKTAVALSDSGTRDSALYGMADALCAPESMDAILAANAEDMAAAKGRISDVMLDRLALTPQRIEAMAKGILDVAALPDPVGRVLSRIERPNGLVIEKTAVPMGVIAIIYESRPNVTSDAAALAIKSGNACILRCGKEAWRSANAIVTTLRQGLRATGLPETAVCLIEDTTHASANALMTAVGYVDLLIPRGGAGLIRACVENAKVPCIQTGTGICHVYVDAAADLEMAVNIVENAKTSRPSVCNAEEALLVHRDVAAQFLPMLKQRLVDDRTAAGLTPVELHLDARAAAIIDGVPAAPADFDTEYLDYKLNVAVVNTLDDAIAHIAKHSTHHSEAVITADKAAAQRFTACVDSAAVYVNTSTRFTDGGEFGLGCEMGISTQKLHARGPMGLAELCTYKYIIHGSGQTRGGAAAKLQTPCC